MIRRCRRMRCQSATTMTRLIVTLKYSAKARNVQKRSNFFVFFCFFFLYSLDNNYIILPVLEQALAPNAVLPQSAAFDALRGANVSRCVFLAILIHRTIVRCFASHSRRWLICNQFELCRAMNEKPLCALSTTHGTNQTTTKRTASLNISPIPPSHRQRSLQPSPTRC